MPMIVVRGPRTPFHNAAALLESWGLLVKPRVPHPDTTECWLCSARVPKNHRICGGCYQARYRADGKGGITRR